MQIAKKGLAILLAMLMVFSTFAVGGAGLALTASAAETGKAIELVTNGAADYIHGAQVSSVWFGNYKQSSDGAGGFYVDPVKWRVLSNADGKLFLLSDKVLDIMRYNSLEQDVSWEICTLRSWLNGYGGQENDLGCDYTGDNFIDNAFSAGETAAIAQTNLVNDDNPTYGTDSGKNTIDRLFPLSLQDAKNGAYGFPDTTLGMQSRIAKMTDYVTAGGSMGDTANMHGVENHTSWWWWLRTAGEHAYEAVFLGVDGLMGEYGARVASDYGVRPALNVDLNSVLFTSAAEGGKAGDGLTAVESYTGTEWKMTLLDDSRSGFSASCIRNQDGVYTIAYSGAQTGENEKISAMIVDADGVVTYYGVLCDAEAGENTLTLDVNGKLNKGDKLYVFNEQQNGDKKTDYASALRDVTGIGSQRSLIVDRTFLKEGVNTANAKTIWYGGSPWRMIGFAGAGAASTADTMTLFANGSMGTTMFDQDGNTKKQYSGSDLQKQTNQIYNNAFSDPEQLAVKDTTLGSGTYDGANTDGVEGSSVGYARLWPLSTKEANAVNADLRKDSGDWWLRSPGDGSNNVAFVTKQGNVDHSGRSFRSELGVRPAFYVDLDRVLFASAAVGGKQGDGALTPIDGYHGNEWKLTVWEGNHRWFSVTETEASGIAGGTFTLHYQYAETGENEYISAIVTDADGNALYYGRIAPATTEDGTVQITIPADLAKGVYTLKVFNEQYNGDRKTDYAGKINQVALTVYGGNSKALQMTESGTAENILGTQQSNIWFGSYQQSSDGNGGYNVDPIKWRVLSNDGGKLFLLSDRSLDAKMYYPQPMNVTWAESTIRSWLNGYDGTANMAGEDHSGDSFKGSAFTETEFAAVAETDVVTENSPEYGTPGGSDTKDKVFLLSLAEAINTVYGFTNSYDPTGTRVSLNTDYAKECSTDYFGNSYSVGEWWLRSPGRDGADAVYIENDGSVYEYGLRVFHLDPCVVRPALNVNLNKVIFTSAAEGGKEGDGLTAVSYYDGADWKLTVLDADRSSFTASCASANGDVRTVKYSGAKTGDNEYISAIIVDGDGAVTDYGRLCKAESGDNNTVTVDVSGKMNDGDKLYVFNEQYNGDKKTDYASALVDVTKASAEPVCRIQDAYYASIGEAVNAVTADDTVITILRDCEFDGLTEVAGHDIILESGETDVTVTLTGAMKFGKNNQSEYFTLRGNSTSNTTLTIRPKLTDGTNAFRPIAIRSGNTLAVESGAILEGSRFTTGNGGMVNVAKNATLYLNGGTIRDCSAIRGGAVYVDGGNCTIYEGRIENCTAEQGGAVYVSYNGKCFLYDGSIENCTAKHGTEATAPNSSVNAAGGAVYAVGLLQMENSTIKNCTAECGKGGGVYLYPEQGTFWMQDSQISGCAATENADADLYYNDGRGGAVYVGQTKNTDAPSLCVVDSRITGNAAKEGGGVYLHEDGTMAAYREAYVSENTGGNVFVSDGAAIIAVMENSQYALTGNALIGVTTRTEPTIGAPVRFGKTKADCKEYFISDSGNADVVYDADGKALLLQCTKKEETPAATFNATGYDTGTLDGLTAGMTYAVNGGTPVTVEGTSVTFTDIALPFVITVVQPGDGVTAYDSDPQTIELTRPDAPALEFTQIEKIGDKGSIPTTTAHQKSTDGVNWTDCDGEWTNLDGGTYYVRMKASGTALASEMQTFIILSDPQVNVTVTATTQKEETVFTATLAEDATGTVSFTLDGNEYWADVEDGKAELRLTLSTGSYALTAKYSGDDQYLSDTVQTSFTVGCAHEWNEPTWDWTDVDNPTYTATCKLCEDGTLTGTVQSTAGTRVEATVNEDAYTPYTATVTLDGQPFTGTFNLVEKGTALGAYKEQMKQAAEDKRLPGDSDACNRLIDDAIDAIDAVTYDETKSLDENKQAVDTAANLAGLEKALTDQRAADAVEDKIDAIGEVELTDESKQKIDDAREAYNDLTDEQKDLVDNVQTLTDAEAEYELLDNKAKFDDYKEAQKQAADERAQDGDSDECAQLIEDAKAAIDAVTYDESQSLDDNKKAVDEAANLAQLDADLAEHRAIHYADFYADGKPVESVPYTIDTKSITAPAVPEKIGHSGAWPDYTLKAGGVRIDAVYTPDPQTVTFDPNGGEGEMEQVNTTWGSTVTLPECGFTAPNGKEFDKWDAGNPGDEVEVKSDLTVKAIWKEKPLTLTADVDPTQTGERIKITVPYARRGGIAAMLTPSEDGVYYESSNPDVISVDKDGVIRLEKLCLFCKTATITAYSADGQKVASCVVNVRHAWWQYIIWFFFGSFWF